MFVWLVWTFLEKMKKKMTAIPECFKTSKEFGKRWFLEAKNRSSLVCSLEKRIYRVFQAQLTFLGLYCTCGIWHLACGVCRSFFFCIFHYFDLLIVAVYVLFQLNSKMTELRLMKFDIQVDVTLYFNITNVFTFSRNKKRRQHYIAPRYDKIKQKPFIIILLQNYKSDRDNYNFFAYNLSSYYLMIIV